MLCWERFWWTGDKRLKFTFFRLLETTTTAIIGARNKLLDKGILLQTITAQIKETKSNRSLGVYSSPESDQLSSSNRSLFCRETFDFNMSRRRSMSSWPRRIAKRARWKLNRQVVTHLPQNMAPKPISRAFSPRARRKRPDRKHEKTKSESNQRPCNTCDGDRIWLPDWIV